MSVLVWPVAVAYCFTVGCLCAYVTFKRPKQDTLGEEVERRLKALEAKTSAIMVTKGLR